VDNVLAECASSDRLTCRSWCKM